MNRRAAYLSRAILAAVFTLPPLSVAAAAMPTPSAPPPSPTPAASPAPPSRNVSVEDEFSPSYYGEGGNSNTVNLRAQLPYAAARWILRLKLPVVTAAPPESITGTGDLSLADLAVTNAGAGQWLGGFTLRVPIGNDSLGTHKYSLGPAGGFATRSGAWTLGFFGQAYFSVIGPSSYPGVGKTQIEPDIGFALQDGWSIGLSTMQFTYDWVRNRWTDVPLGFRVSRRFGRATPFDAYLEGERNLAHAEDTPGWTIRSLLRWRIPEPNLPSVSDDDQ